MLAELAEFFESEHGADSEAVEEALGMEESYHFVLWAQPHKFMEISAVIADGSFAFICCPCFGPLTFAHFGLHSFSLFI